ncbi:RNA polymerase sigma-70 factor, ECF subfamily [Amycolatopsis marina]|uniref:RNA polymerase sigma-70 factor, ECF subfamily n=1 Tax=Amycolatopsis marina TaxID=490629 RepID=A0A1I0VDV5_9PSEU|nr:sigma-70 family RNA polymerase sigma factor [Amycolatopsis marina]SFA74452.1 RNA polymerase sigma-70 factor, ECF subfamily [Amycolatopsis marina]
MTTRGGRSADTLGSDETEEFWQECVRLRSALVRAAATFGVEADAEDIVHEAFLRAARYDDLDLDRLSRFLSTVTRRLCVDDLRRRVALQAAAVHPRVLLPSVGALEDPEETVLCREEARWLIARFGRLSERERFVLLHLERGVSHDEIARRLGTTRRATESIASRARRRVRELMARRARCDRVLGD